MRRYHLVAMTLAVAVALVGCGATAAGPEPTSSSTNLAPTPPTQSGAPPVSSLPISSLPQTTSAAPSQAFLEGYRAYQNHDLATAIERLGYASDHYPRLVDYALYYRGLALRDSGDLAGSAATFEKLIRDYSESVTIGDAEVALSDVYLRLTRATDAAAA